MIDWLMVHISIGLVQERRNSSALAMELRLCCTNPSIYFKQHLAMTFCVKVLLLSLSELWLNAINMIQRYIKFILLRFLSYGPMHPRNGTTSRVSILLSVRWHEICKPNTFPTSHDICNSARYMVVRIHGGLSAKLSDVLRWSEVCAESLIDSKYAIHHTLYKLRRSKSCLEFSNPSEIW